MSQSLQKHQEMKWGEQREGVQSFLGYQVQQGQTISWIWQMTYMTAACASNSHLCYWSVPRSLLWHWLSLFTYIFRWPNICHLLLWCTAGICPLLSYFCFLVMQAGWLAQKVSPGSEGAAPWTASSPGVAPDSCCAVRCVSEVAEKGWRGAPMTLQWV